MKYIVFDDMSACTEAEVRRLYLLASRQRQHEAMKYKHLFGQFACLKAYELLVKLINETLSQDESRGQACLDYAEAKKGHRPKGGNDNLSQDESRDQACLDYAEAKKGHRPKGGNDNENRTSAWNLKLGTWNLNEHGKPYLEGLPDVHFNLSHCKNAIAVAVDNKPVGIDVERFIEPSDSLLRYCMSDQEAEQVRQAEHPDEVFSALWTRKEALVKYYGTGITSDLKEILTHPDPEVRLTTTLNRTKGYALTIATSAD